MMLIETKDLTQISGGISKSLLGAIVMGGIMLASIIYGFISPYKCGRD